MLFTHLNKSHMRRPSRGKPSLIKCLQHQSETRQVSHKGALAKTVSAPIPQDKRSQQLVEMGGGEALALSDEEKKNRRNMQLAWGALGINSVALFIPLLQPLAMPSVGIALLPVIQNSIRRLREGKNRAAATIELLSNVCAFSLGYYFIGSVALTAYYASNRLLLQTQSRANQNLAHIFGEQPRTVWICSAEKGTEIEIPFEQLTKDHIAVVTAGQTIPVDGTIVQGVATIDQRALTGESQPVEKGRGDSVLASTIMLAGHLHIRVTKAGAETTSAQVRQILSQTADFKSSVESRGERIVEQGAKPTLLLSALALPTVGVSGAFGVLFASFGYHMKIAGPMGVLNFLRLTSENGILVKDGRALELLSEVDTVIFDKTGTLTEEIPTVGYVHSCSHLDADQLLTLAAAAETKQTHPIAHAILNNVRQRGLELPPIQAAEYELGYGLKVKAILPTGDVWVSVGSGRFMSLEGVTIPSEMAAVEQQCHAEGHTLIYVAVDGVLGGAIELIPTIRSEAEESIEALRRRKLKLAIISGDHERPTQKLARQLGIDEYFAEVLPQDKAQLIAHLQAQGRSVCFIGDGINDAIALKTTNVGISIRGASTAATDTAAIILMDGSLQKLVTLFDLAEQLDRNLTTSTVMTVIPGVVCVGGIFFFHFGFLSALAIFYAGLGISIANAVWPHFAHQQTQYTPISCVH